MLPPILIRRAPAEIGHNARMSNSLEGMLLVALLLIGSIGFPILTVIHRAPEGLLVPALLALLVRASGPRSITVMVLKDRETGLRYGFGG